MRSLSQLEAKLRRLEGRGYKALKEITGSYQMGQGVWLDVVHVQGDPFASPSRMQLRIPLEVVGFPEDLYRDPVRRIALQDYTLRVFEKSIRRFSRPRGTGKSGLYFVDAGRQKVLLRSDCQIKEDHLIIRFCAGLPARGRSILGHVAADMLCREVPEATSRIRWELFNQREALDFINTVEDAEHIRSQLTEKGIVAFIADGSILPRRSGVEDTPLPKAIPFKSPETLKISFKTLHHGEITGMGIPQGVTLIVGGGFHGKSTLLNAIEQGIYPHIPGDGREFVVTHPAAVKVRSEDGRYVAGVNISCFIKNLPLGIDTTFFSTENASGSTSVAAAIMEAIEMGARVLLIDEDTTATNFLIRDARMQKLIVKEKEPITPFIDRVRELYERLGISTIMVVGGAGDYLDVADTVICMDSYIPRDYTQRAKEIAEEMPSGRIEEARDPIDADISRVILPETFTVKKSHKVKSKGLKEIQFGTETIDVSFVEQLVDDSQLRFIAEALKYLAQKRRPGAIRKEIEAVDRLVREQGFDAMFNRYAFGLAYARSFEVSSSLNRMRTLKVRREESK